MLSLLCKIWLKYKKTIIISLKLHQISTNQFIIYQNYIWTKHIIFQKRKFSQKYQQQLRQKTANNSNRSYFAETTPAEAATTPAHSAVAPTVVSEKKGSHKDYLTIFSQTMNLMSNIFPPSKRSHFRWHHLTANTCDSTIKSLTFLLLAKKQNLTNETTYFVKDFSLFAKFSFNQF